MALKEIAERGRSALGSAADWPNVRDELALRVSELFLQCSTDVELPTPKPPLGAKPTAVVSIDMIISAGCASNDPAFVHEMQSHILGTIRGLESPPPALQRIAELVVSQHNYKTRGPLTRALLKLVRAPTVSIAPTHAPPSLTHASSVQTQNDEHSNGPPPAKAPRLSVNFTSMGADVPGQVHAET